MLRGLGLLREGRPEPAAIAFSTLAPTASMFPDALVGRLIAAWCTDDWPEATHVLRVITRTKGVVRPRRQVLRELHRLLVEGGAVTALQAARNRAEIEADTLLTLDALLAAGQSRQARRAVLLLQASGWAAPLAAAAAIFLRHRDHGTALHLVRAAEDAGFSGIALLELKARILDECGEPAAACSLYLEAIETAPDRVQNYLALARSLQAHGRKVLGRRARR